MTSSRHSKMARCLVCQRVFQTVKALRRHISMNHQPERYLYPCEWCGIAYQSISAMRRHAAQKHPDIVVREPEGFFTNYPAADARPIPRLNPTAATTSQPRVITNPSKVKFQTVKTSNRPHTSKVTTKQVRPQPTVKPPVQRPPVNQQLPFSAPARASVNTNTPTTPGTPLMDEQHNRTTPLLNTVNTQLQKHKQVHDSDSFLRDPDYTSHPDLADVIDLVSDTEGEDPLPPVRKYPRLSTPTTPSTVTSFMTFSTPCSVQATDSPCPLAAALGSTPSPPTVSKPRIPSRWDTPDTDPSPRIYVNPTPNLEPTPPRRSRVTPSPVRPTNSPASKSTPNPPVGTSTGLPLTPTDPVSALSLLTDYGSSDSANNSPAKSTTPCSAPNLPINVDSTDAPPPVMMNVTPTRQQPLQVDLDEAVDLLNQISTICETLLPGHGQFLCHVIYLYFLQHIQLPP